jgi:cytochrome P450
MPSEPRLAKLVIAWGRKVLAEVATVARPDTILAWYRKLVACKFDGSQVRHGPGRPRIKREVEQLIVRMAGENRDWGYDRIAGALAKSVQLRALCYLCGPWRGRVITHNNPSYRTDNPSSPVLKAVRRVLPDACISDTKIKIQTRH